MANDLATQLRKLQDLRSLIGEASYAESLAKLRAQYGDQAVDAFLQPPSTSADGARSHTLVTNASTDIAIAGDVHGNIYLYGRRTKSAEQFLAAYLGRMIKRCGVLPLQGIREQRAADDVLAIRLEQVYTKLATTALVQRETYNGAALEQFDASAYLVQHVGEHLPPEQQRVYLHGPSNAAMQMDRMRRDAGEDNIDVLEGLVAYRALKSSKQVEETPLATLDACTLSNIATRTQCLEFSGPQLVTEAIATHRRVVLLGEPGSGKSTVLRYLALTLAEAVLHDDHDLAALLDGWSGLGVRGRLLPIYLPLLPFTHYLAKLPSRPGSADDLWNYLAGYLEASGLYEGLAAVVHAELEAGRALLLLDGLDEVATTASRRQVVRAVQSFADDYPGSRIVVACRLRAYEGLQNQAWQLPGWPTAILADWTLGQMERFVTAWYTAAAAASGMPPAKCDARTLALRHAITSRADLRRLGVRPLLMTIMALVHLNDGRLPEERVTLYSRCLDLLLGQWELAREDGSGYGTLMDYIGLPDTDVRSLRPLLETAAFQAHTAGHLNKPGSLSRATLRELVGAELHRRGHPDAWTGAERFLDYTDIRAGLLQASDAGDTYIFPHQTFQEYLAGLRLVSGVEAVRRIMDVRMEDRWRVPIMLGIGYMISEGMLAVPYQLLEALMHTKGRTSEHYQRDLLLAAEIGHDADWDRIQQMDGLFEHVRNTLASKLVEVVQGDILPEKDRANAGRYLGDLGDPRSGVCRLPPDMVLITGGTFLMGSTSEEAQEVGRLNKTYYLEHGDQPAATFFHTWPETEINDQLVTVSDFFIARYPVTNAQFALFIADDGYNHDRPWWDVAGRQWLCRDDTMTSNLTPLQRRQYKRHPELWYSERFGKVRPNQPVVGISWYEAVAFCRWLTQHAQFNPAGHIYRLPFEDEWEFAARGSNRYLYPWGLEPPDARRANFDRIYDAPVAVGCFSLGATREGVHDMVGNIWEWTGSVFASYPHRRIDENEILAKKEDVHFAIRGGSWRHHSTYLRSSTRGSDNPDNHDDNHGFRIASSPLVADGVSAAQ